MAGSGQELEVKFMISDLAKFRLKLETLGANLEQDRQHEVNLRFDTPDGEMARTYRVLRLRQDSVARVTYKGPGSIQDGVRLRQELEFTVSDFATAKALFEALGYQVAVIYEKYRTVFNFAGCEISLDEMPYGSFLEIEGPSGAHIQQVARQLELDWDARIMDSYIMLFDRICQAMNLKIKDLTFNNFAGIAVPVVLFGARPADVKPQSG